jgi:RNA polymerase sigma-70 factor (TIGR02960 family)
VDSCRSCGRPLAARANRPGRASEYCSAACRQRAYRSRHTPAGDAVQELIADIGRRVQGLAPQLPGAFYSEVTALSSSVGRLRRIARVACDAAQSEPEVVTHTAVTEPAPDPRAAGEAAGTVAAVRTGGEGAFAGLVEPYRRELQVHCYRMVGSYDDSEDLVQETFLHAWRRRDSFEGRSTFRGWLYRIATNACLDFLRRNNRRPQRYEPLPGMDHGGGEPPARIAWLQPYPDHLLADVPSPDAEPAETAVSRETIELVFLAAIQHLPPRQRAVLILRDVLGWPAADAAALLEMSVASANSALQRARPTLRQHLPERRLDWAPSARPSRAEREILDRYMDAAVREDTAAMAEMLSADVRLTMPPNPYWFTSREAILNFVRPVFDATSPMYLGQWRHLPTRANGQPAVAAYIRRTGTAVYRPQVLDVLRIEDGLIVEITSFEPHLFTAFGLPLTLR